MSLPEQKYRKDRCTSPSIDLNKNLKFYFKVFKTLYFLNAKMDFVYIWYDHADYSCWSRILLGTIPTHA